MKFDDKINVILNEAASNEVTPKLEDNLKKAINKHIKDGSIYFSNMLSRATFFDDLEFELDRDILINGVMEENDGKGWRALIRKIKKAEDININIKERNPIGAGTVNYKGIIDIDGAEYPFDINSDISVG